jgi:hypothetical protein
MSIENNKCNCGGHRVRLFKIIKTIKCQNATIIHLIDKKIESIQ